MRRHRKWNPLVTKLNCTATLESSLAVLQLVTYEPTIPLLDIYLRKLNTCGHTKICTQMFITALSLYGQKVETTQMSFS